MVESHCLPGGSAGEERQLGQTILFFPVVIASVGRATAANPPFPLRQAPCQLAQMGLLRRAFPGPDRYAEGRVFRLKCKDV